MMVLHCVAAVLLHLDSVLRGVGEPVVQRIQLVAAPARAKGRVVFSDAEKDGAAVARGRDDVVGKGDGRAERVQAT